MKASSGNFLKVHIATIVILFGSTFLFVTVMDPFRIFEYSWSQTGPRHQNVTLRKYEMMESYPGVQAVVLGSSTSENYSPVDIEKIFGFKAFHAAVPGSQALARTVLLKKAFLEYPDLKLVLYIADFFEANDNAHLLFNHEVTRNSRLSALIPNAVEDFIPFQLKEYIWDVFSHQSVESALRQIRIQTGDKKLTHYRENGTISALSESPASQVALDHKGLGSEPLSEWLRQKIDQNWLQYKSNALRNFAFSARIAKLYEHVLEGIESSDTKIIFILSPLHPRFLDKMASEASLSQPSLSDAYHQWQSSMAELTKYQNVIVFNPLSTGLALPSIKPYWRDGVHYNQDISAMILREVVP